MLRLIKHSRTFFNPPPVLSAKHSSLALFRCLVTHTHRTCSPIEKSPLFPTDSTPSVIDRTSSPIANASPTDVTQSLTDHSSSPRAVTQSPPGAVTSYLNDRTSSSTLNDCASPMANSTLGLSTTSPTQTAREFTTIVSDSVLDASPNLTTTIASPAPVTRNYVISLCSTGDSRLNNVSEDKFNTPTKVSSVSLSSNEQLNAEKPDSTPSVIDRTSSPTDVTQSLTDHSSSPRAVTQSPPAAVTSYLNDRTSSSTLNDCASLMANYTLGFSTTSPTQTAREFTTIVSDSVLDASPNLTTTIASPAPVTRNYVISICSTGDSRLNNVSEDKFNTPAKVSSVSLSSNEQLNAEKPVSTPSVIDRTSSPTDVTQSLTDHSSSPRAVTQSPPAAVTSYLNDRTSSSTLNDCASLMANSTLGFSPTSPTQTAREFTTIVSDSVLDASPNLTTTIASPAPVTRNYVISLCLTGDSRLNNVSEDKFNTPAKVSSVSLSSNEQLNAEKPVSTPTTHSTLYYAHHQETISHRILHTRSVLKLISISPIAVSNAPAVHAFGTQLRTKVTKVTVRENDVNNASGSKKKRTSFYADYPLRGRNRIPDDRVDFKHIIKRPISQQEIGVLTPADPAIEVKFTDCHNEDAHSMCPKFRMHAIMASHVEDNKLVHLVDTASTKKSDWSEEREKIENDIKRELSSSKDISQKELEALWYDDGPDIMNFWIKRFIKHHRFSFDDPIPNYATLTGLLAKKYLVEQSGGEYFGKVLGSEGVLGIEGADRKAVLKCRGEDGKGELGQFLASKGLKAGQYHQTSDLQDAVDEYFGAKGFPTFTTQGDHVALHEICTLLSEDAGQV